MKPITLEEQKQEAISRMKMLKLYEPVIEDFKRGQLYKSEAYGVLYWLNEEEEKLVRDFEKEYNAVVYHIIKSNTEFGELLTYLFVSQHKEEWTGDREDIKENISFCYVKNLTTEYFSEFGSISFMPMIGGLVRTA